MKEIIGTSNRVLEVNLTTGDVKEFRITKQDRRLYLGGKGLGLKYIYERMKPGVDPLGEDNILAFMMGVYMGTGAPCSGRFAAITKSPLTGILASSSCGGPFGKAFKTAGYDGLLITGKSDDPVSLVINADVIKLEDASRLWGQDTVETQEALNLSKKDGALVIGPAGENKVLYANIASGSRFLGRAGMGAVMGSKNLKAIVAHGNEYKIIPKHKAAFNRLNRKATRYINNNFFTADLYRNYGTASNFKFCNKGGILPILNFKAGKHEKTVEVSGETMQAKYNTRPNTCLPCTILCGHEGTYKDGSVHKIPEYETTALLGPNLGIFDTDLITEWNDLCGKLGMDTISTGTSLSYVMEAGEKGIIKTDLKFGTPDGISDSIKKIAYRKQQGDELANGVKRLAEKYGGQDFAIHVKGLELPAYDPRGSWGQGLAYAVANRGGCHLSASLFPLEVFTGLLNPYTTRAKPEFVRFFEDLYSAVNSMQTCLFTAYAYVLEPPIVKYTPKPLLNFTMQNLPGLAIKFMNVSLFSHPFEAITGIKMSPKDLLEAGDRIHILERYMNTREGISRKDDILPARFLKEGRECDPQKRTVPLEKMLKKYYKLRGYDEHGIPTLKTLKKLGISVSE